MPITAKRFYDMPPAEADPVEADFYARLKMRNGTFKLTRPNRFQSVEDAFAPEIERRASTIREVLDVGVSTGVTTLDLDAMLAASGVTATLTATDLYIEAQIVDLAGGVRVLADSSGWPLQFDLFGRPIRSWTRRLDYATLAFLPLAAARAVARARLPGAIAKGRTRPVRMVTRRAEAESRVTFEENDLFAHTGAFADRFDLVRAANILNLNYFDTETIRLGLENLRHYLRGPGALLWIARTEEDGHNTATLFELGTDRRFTVVASVGGGSEIEPIVLDLPAAAEAG